MPHSSLLVGVTSLSGSAAWLEQNTRNYLNVLSSHGASPVVLAPDIPALLPDGRQFELDSLGRLPDGIVDLLDGLILSGGGDVAPSYFGQELNGAEPDRIDLRRDELELGLARRAVAADLPIFGICRGSQVLNVAAGGSMIQHFEGHRSPPDATAFHDVVVSPSSRFRHIVGQEVLSVNTFHHQGMGLANLAPAFAPAALAQPDDWLVEAFESPAHRWVIGVQWHPERSFELDTPHALLWHSFFTACRERAAVRIA